MSEASAPVETAEDRTSARPAGRPRPAGRWPVLTWAVLSLIVAAGLALRLHNVDWDDGQHLHPDERFLTIVASELRWPSGPAEYFDSARSPLNPYNHGHPSFVYGTLPLFLTLAVGEAVDKTSYGDVYLVGRVLSALFDAGTLVVLFLLGGLLYDRRVGLLAAALGAFAVLHIQLSHFFAVDTFLAFFVTLTVYASARIARGGGTGSYLLAGIAFGLAMASKASALPAAGLIALGALAAAWPALPGNGTPWQEGRAVLARAAARLVLAAVVSFLVFRILNPYVFAGPNPWNVSLDERFRADVESFQALSSGEIDFPPAMQWVDRAAYLFPLENMVRWGMGWPLGIAAVAGVAFAAWELVRRGRLDHLLPLVWAVGYFGWTGRSFAFTMRYFLPVYPVLILFAAYLLVRAVGSARATSSPEGAARRGRRLMGSAALAAAGLALAVVVGGTALWALAFNAVYTRPVTRVAASEWIYQNIPPGSAITSELWDDGLPLRLPGADPNAYEPIQMRPFDADTPEKRRELIDQLSRADYVIISSNRTYGAIGRLPLRYPLTGRYYHLLFSGELGFEKVAEFTSYPSIFGRSIPDDGAEEAFTVYDHPKVLVFRKTADFSAARVQDLLPESLTDRAVHVPPIDLDKHALLLTERDREAQQTGGTWSAIFDSGSITNRYPTATWLLAVELIGLAATPLLFWALRPLPDRGYALAKPVGLLVFAYVVWLGVSLDLFTFTRTAVLLTGAALLVAGGAAAVLQRGEIRRHARDHWREILTVEALFLASFAAFYLIRTANPDLWHPYRGGEKPMDLAYLIAVTRSTTLPPYDPWFAGGVMNYYYFGQFILAALIKGTGILPEVAFNLAIPLLFSLTAVGAYAVVSNLVRAGGASRRAGALAGLLGVVFLGVLGNLNAVDQTYHALMRVTPWRAAASVPILGHGAALLGGLLEVGVRGASLPPLDYWRSSRMLPPSFAITEFPFFSFLFADLHAHLIALPFTVAFLGLAAGTALSGRPSAASGRTWAILGLMGLTAGALRWINSWDYPGYVLLGVCAIAIAHVTAVRSWRPGLLFPFAAHAAAFVGLSMLLFLPFSGAYQQFYAGVHRSEETTPIHQYLSHFGLFAFVTGAFLVTLALSAFRRSTAARHVRLLRHGRPWTALRRYYRFVREPSALVILTPSFVVVGTVLFAAAWSWGAGLVALLMLPLGLTITLLVREGLTERSAPRMLVLAMVALALGVSIGVDTVTIDGDIVRMNTVFKFYLQAWTLLALASAYGVWWIASRARFVRAGGLRAAWAGTLLLLVLGAALYPLRSTPARLDERFAPLAPALDGAAYMRESIYHDEHGDLRLAYDYEAIQWLRQNVDGTPVIIEGQTPNYRWGSRFSIYTGLPTVIGWDWHETQQRWRYQSMISRRSDDVRRFYDDPDPGMAREILDRYGVRYVIVGELERAYYSPAGIAKFERGLVPGLEPVFRNEGVTIYRVEHERVRAGAVP